MPTYLGPVYPGMPSFMFTSEIGVHIMDFEAFMESSLPAPISANPEKAQWSSSVQIEEVLHDLPPSHPWNQDAHQEVVSRIEVMAYNASRDIDRVCPACRRWYRVGERGFKEYNTFDEFVHRPMIIESEVSPIVTSFQDKRGICNAVCYTVKTSLFDSFFPEGSSHLSPEMVERINEGPMGEISARKPMTEEKAKGLQIVYCSH